MSEAPPAQPSRSAFRLLFAALLVIGVGNTMLFALLPPLAREIGVPDSLVGAIFSLSALIWVFSSPFWGRRSDAIGRRPVIALGLAAYAVSMTGFAGVAILGLAGLAPALAAFTGFALARAVFGLMGSAVSPAAQAYVADHTDPANRTEEIGALTAGFALGSAVGPALCALLAAELGLVAPILLVAAAAAIASYTVFRRLPEGPRTPAPQPSAAAGFKESLRIARDPRVSGYLVYAIGMSTITGALAQTYGFFTIDRLGVEGAHAAELAAAGYMVGALALLAAQLGLLPRLKLQPRGLMMAGAGLLAAGVTVQAWAGSLGALLVAQMLQGLGFGLARPGFTGGASLGVAAEDQGAVAGLVVACNGAGFIIAPLIGGVLYQVVSPLATLAVVFALTAALGLFAWRSRRLKG